MIPVTPCCLSSRYILPSIYANKTKNRYSGYPLKIAIIGCEGEDNSLNMSKLEEYGPFLHLYSYFLFG